MKGRFYTPRESYVPKGAVKVADKQSDAVAYLYTLYTRDEKHGVVAFVGNQAKPVGHYIYTNVKRREDYVRGVFEGRRLAMAYKAERAAEKKAFVHDFKVGDILHTSWGWEQTNVNYYEVVEVSGKMLTVRETGASSVDTGYMQGRSRPVAGRFIGQPIRCLAQKGGVKIDGHYAWRVEKDATGTYAENHWSSYA